MPEDHSRQDSARSTPRGEADATIAALFNPGAGRDRTAEDTARIERKLRDLPGVAIHELDPDTPIEAAARRAAQDGHRVVVAAGGDGTVSAVAGALVGTEARLGIVPLGTFNFLARALGIPQDPLAAIDLLSDAPERRLSVGEVNGEIFINNASLGAYASVLQAREEIYGRWGRSRLAAYWSVIVALLTLYRTLAMTARVDGRTERIRSPLVFVAVRPFQLEKYGLSGADAVKDGELAVYLAPAGGRLTLLWRALRVLLRTTEAGRDYRLITASDITLHPDRDSLLVARDGERDRMTGPFRFRLRENALTVIAPGDAHGDTPGDTPK